MRPFINIAGKRILFLLIYIILPTQGHSQKYDVSQFALKDSKSAVERALEFTGFDKSRNFSYDSSIGKVELTEAIDTTTPFLYEGINGRLVWLVEFKNIFLNPTNYDENKLLNKAKDFMVYVDAENGHLLKIFSPYVGPEKNRPYYIPLIEAEKQIKACNEKYLGFLDSLPNIDFYDAANKGKMPHPAWAKEIQVVCILHSQGDKIATPTWMISLFGIPPMGGFDHDSRYKKAGEYNRHCRLLVNASTGEVIITIRYVDRIATEDAENEKMK